MQSKGIRVVAAVLLAIVGTLVLVRYVENARQDAVAAESPVPVIFVDQPIKKGTGATEVAALVRQGEIPAKLKAPDAVTDLAQLKDLHASVDLLPGEQLTKARFTTAGAAARGDVPAGLLQVTVKLDAVRALGGRVRPGDTVGVVTSLTPVAGNGADAGTATHLALHKVLVTDVQGAAPPATDADKNGVSAAPAGDFLITLALDAPAVEQVVFAAENGKMWLSAEPAAASEGGTRIVTRGNVYGGAQ